MAKRDVLIDSLTQFTADFLRFASAETRYFEHLGGVAPSEDEIMIREENQRLKQQLEQLQSQVSKLTERVTRLESKLVDAGGDATDKKTSAPPPSKVQDDDDVDLFDSDEEDDAETARVKEERLAAYAAKKSAKPGVIAKSNVILDVKPWDDETDMKELEKAVRSVVMDGLLWGVSKLMPVGYGINKLQIATVVEDEKVSIDDLVEKLQEFEDFVQSVDIAAFNKI